MVTYDRVRGKTSKSKARFPKAEETLFLEFADRRAVGVKVSGLWLRARMLEIVREGEDEADDKQKRKIQRFVGSDC